ncbi:MAG TPA: acyl-CoA dehydrogenase [Candidatus Brocadiia bacterium]|nr:acyl-CoA dehydrogenase [Candidatus Brocadiales bacterium]
MEFELTEEQKMLQQMARNFAKGYILPGIRERDAKGEFPAEIIEELGKLGFMGVLIPEAYGGAGMDAMSLAIVIEELARIDASVAITVAAHNSLCTNHIYTFGTEEQRRKYVVPLAIGKELGAWSLTESNAGSDAASIESTAVLSGDKWVLNGTKIFVSQGSTADIYVVMAVTERTKGRQGISAFIVEKGTSGLSVGKKEDKLGLRTSDTASIILEDCRIPVENLLGDVNSGYQDVLKILDGGRIGIGAMAVGIGSAALEESMEYAKKRMQFGKPIAEFQAIQWMLADMATELDAARLLVYKAAYLKTNGLSFTKEASQAKLFASEVGMRAATKAVQIFGGHGYIKDYPVERFFRDVKICEIGEGTSEIQRLVISRELLK